MNRLGKYCKAYPLDDLRQFDGWNEEVKEVERKDAGGEAANETDVSDILFLQENYTVTAGIFLDEHVVFDKVTPEWIEFCRETLKFELPAVDAGEENSVQAGSLGG